MRVFCGVNWGLPFMETASRCLIWSSGLCLVCKTLKAEIGLRVANFSWWLGRHDVDVIQDVAPAFSSQ